MDTPDLRPADGRPTPTQQRILDAYLETPNAAAVARSVGVSERNVRRIRDRFSEELRARWQQRDDERRGRIDARHAKLEDWADRVLDGTLERLEALSASADEGAALRAVKLTLEIATHDVERRVASSIAPDLEAMALVKQREWQDRLRVLAAEEASGGSAK